MSDSIAASILLKPLAGLFNRRIDDSSQARNLCKRLDGRTLALQLSPDTPHSSLAIYLSIAEERVSVHGSCTDEPDVIIAAGLTGLLDLASDRAEEAIRAGRVRFFGDSDIAQDFRKLLQLTRPDWEEELSRLTGDAAAHQIGNLFRSALGFGRKIFSTVTQNAAEFLQEESRDLPSKPEFDRWLEETDELREDTDRLEARIQRLEAAGSNGGGSA